MEELSANDRIDRAAVLTGCYKLAEAGVAAQALVYIAGLAGSCFVGKIGISDEATAYFYYIHDTIGKRLFHESGVSVGTNGGYGCLDMFFDLRRILHIYAVGEEH